MEGIAPTDCFNKKKKEHDLMEGDLIKINNWLLPLSWIYGVGVNLRNKLFDWGLLRQQAYAIPVISVGNITVGGTGKTPHVEYLANLLHGVAKVAVLSRGYKRKTRGYILADNHSTARDIGDEPYQMKQKFHDMYVAVDKNRREGIERLTHDEATRDVEVVLLDDAFQHRYVKPGINILLVDYHRLIVGDKLLPAGRLREPKYGKSRADIVIITKCPKGLSPIEIRVLTKAMDLFPYQQLYFTYIDYGKPYLLTDKGKNASEGRKRKNVLLITGIGSPRQMENDLRGKCLSLVSLSYADHHDFTEHDAQRINEAFAAMPSPKTIITTEKDATRLKNLDGLSSDVRDNLYVLPISVRFMLGQEEAFNSKIISYVRKNSRNSILAKGKDDGKAKDRNNPGHRPRTISFRDNL